VGQYITRCWHLHWTETIDHHVLQLFSQPS
jgi:hypothetical protein